MNTFRLLIQTVDGQVLDASVQQLICRTIEGDVAIMAGHCNYCTAIGMGQARITMEDGTTRTGVCIGGMISMHEGECRLLPTTWEWAAEIDIARAQEAKRLAEQNLAKHDLTDEERAHETARLQRAEIRLSIASLSQQKR